MNTILFFFEPDRINGTGAWDYNPHLFYPIWALSGTNALCYILFVFMRFRKARDPKDPHNITDLYKISNWCDTFKRVVFVICFFMNTVAVPVCTIIWFIMQGEEKPLYERPYHIWAFTFLFLSLVPPLQMIWNFNILKHNKCGQNFEGPYKLNEWKKVILG
jgi:hypothetical protein